MCVGQVKRTSEIDSYLSFYNWTFCPGFNYLFFAMQDKERMAYEWLEGGYKEEQVGVRDYKNTLFLVMCAECS